jgi:hypothetical protein
VEVEAFAEALAEGVVLEGPGVLGEGGGEFGIELGGAEGLGLGFAADAGVEESAG